MGYTCPEAFGINMERPMSSSGLTRADDDDDKPETHRFFIGAHIWLNKQKMKRETHNWEEFCNRTIPLSMYF